MTTLEMTATKEIQKASWIILIAVAVLATLSAVYVTITPAGSQTDLATRAWEEFSTADPEVAALFEMQLTLVGLTGAGYALFGALVTLNAFRRGQKWAWFAMWLFPLVFGAIAIRMLIEPYDVGYLYAVYTLLTVIALLIPIRRFF